MTNPQINQFIIENIRKGYTLQQMRQHLLSNHVPQNVVDQAVYEVQSSMQQQQSAQQYPQQQQQIQQPQPTSYPQQRQPQTFQQQQSAQQYPQQQYPQQQQQPTQPEKRSGALGYFILLVIFVSLGFSGYYLYGELTASSPELEQPAMIFKPIYILAKEELNAGEFAELSISTKIMPIDAEIRLINAKTREEISASNENINKEYYTIKLKIPENTASDKYFIEISSKYKEIVSDTSYLITVTSTITEPEKGKCPSCDDGNKCTEDICSKETFYECEYKKILPCCGDKICSLNENCPEECKKASSLIKPEPQKSNEAQEIMNNLDLVKKMSLSNKEAAMKICNDMVLTSAKDQCYLNIVMNNPDVSICGQISNSAIYDSCYNMIAQDSGDPVFCEKSIDSDNRDTCLFTFTSREDFTVCEKILDPTRRNICNSLKEYRTLSG